ncbi:MAG: TPR repeat-containing protein YfgC precursor [Candidatus Hydrogenedentes bacterium ADurb.Bin101]|nr:MAG: TPR repeat-containing protein YfgC precursor [Candidatus Hydrogenedentes bacterium ADurb.Bin101]
MAARFSRAQEREADSTGMDILYRAGYPPEAMVSFMNKLLALDRESGGGRSLPIFATHPSPEERVALLQDLMRQYPEENHSYGEDRYFEEVRSHF